MADNVLKSQMIRANVPSSVGKMKAEPLKTYAPNLGAFRANSKSKTSQRIWLAKSSIVWQIARQRPKNGKVANADC